MEINPFEHGNKVLIEAEEMMGETEFNTIVEDIDENVLKIHSPIYKGALLRLRENTRVSIMVFADCKLYKARAVVVKNSTEGNFHFAYLELISEIKRYERRSYFRLSKKLDIRIIIKDTDEAYTGRTLDISAGGIQLESEKELYKGEELIIEADLNGTHLELDGVVVNTMDVLSTGEKRYGIKFEDLGEKVEDKIMRYIFEVQREERKKDKRIRG